ncbi:MAG: aminotransferase class I/II-fold pyridoxal phosphate-dependent enzyme [Lentisphaeraceae bacterium]|nr:aminotransferase class I/II-fold pyridoxal phosphate-dependent enzyme [Lentisphaeraceae bacterium]
MKLNSYLTQKREYPLFIYARKAEELRSQGVDVINLTIGDPLDNTYPAVREATIKALQSKSNSRYPASKGEPELLQAVADWAKRNHDVSLDPKKHILSCNGSKEAIFHAAMLFDWSDGGEIFIPSLSYPVYENSAALHGVTSRYLPLSEETNFLPDLDALTESDWQKCRMFWINTPHNPTTAIASLEYLQKLVDLAEKYDFLICADECYNDIHYGATPPSILDTKQSENWILFRSLSKRSHMTGYRCGAIISHNEELMAAFGRMRAPMGQGSPTFIQAGAIEAWKDDEHPKEFTKDYLLKKQTLQKALEDKGFKIFGGEASFYLWFSHPEISESTKILDLFIEQGIVITPGTAFGPDGEGYVRMVFCVTKEVCDKTAARIGKIKI